jgi:hypothetical protein
MSAAQVSAENVARFALAGNARVTLQSERTGSRFTFRIKAPRGKIDEPLRFVEVLTGSDNESDYTYLGVIDANGFRRTAKSRISADAPSARAIAWAWPHIAAGSLPDTLAVYHEGRCGRCARPLTDPVSIESGLGPECRRR